MREAPEETNPAAALSAWKDVASPDFTAPSPPSAPRRPVPPPPGSRRTSRGQVQARQVPSHPNASPAVPFQGGGEGARGLDSSLRLRSGGRKRPMSPQERRAAPPQRHLWAPKGEENKAAQGFRREPGRRRPSPRMLFPGPRGATPRVQPAPPPRLSAVPTQRLQAPGSRPSAAHDGPHLQTATPGGGGGGRQPHARTLAPTDIGSSSLSAHRACARAGVPPRPAPSPANPHSRRHACALAAQRPNHPFSKLRDPPFATKDHWHPIRIEVVVGGSRKSNSQ